MDLFEKCDHFETLKQVRKLGIYPYFHELESRQAPVVQMENHRVIMLGSNNYLGFTENEAVIQRSVSRLTEGKTLIVIAHRLSTITDADRIYVVKDGQIDDSGTHEELLSHHGLYEKMYKAHMEVKDHA